MDLLNIALRCLAMALRMLAWGLKRLKAKVNRQSRHANWLMYML